jgi:hypothetical protein
MLRVLSHQAIRLGWYSTEEWVGGTFISCGPICGKVLLLFLKKSRMVMSSQATITFLMNSCLTIWQPEHVIGKSPSVTLEKVPDAGVLVSSRVVVVVTILARAFFSGQFRATCPTAALVSMAFGVASSWWELTRWRASASGLSLPPGGIPITVAPEELATRGIALALCAGAARVCDPDDASKVLLLEPVFTMSLWRMSLFLECVRAAEVDTHLGQALRQSLREGGKLPGSLLELAKYLSALPSFILRLRISSCARFCVIDKHLSKFLL